MSVPLTSSRARTQTKSVCFQQTERNHMSQKNAGEQEEPTGAGGAFIAGHSEPKQCFEHKIAECPFNVELVTDRVSGWLSGDPEGCRLTYWLDADS